MTLNEDRRLKISNIPFSASHFDIRIILFPFKVASIENEVDPVT